MITDSNFITDQSLFKRKSDFPMKTDDNAQARVIVVDLGCDLCPFLVFDNHRILKSKVGRNPDEAPGQVGYWAELLMGAAVEAALEL